MVPLQGKFDTMLDTQFPFIGYLHAAFWATIHRATRETRS